MTPLSPQLSPTTMPSSPSTKTRSQGFVSLEGYLSGRLAIAGLQMCGADLDRQCFLDSVRNAGAIDIDGIALQFGPGDNQGSDAVFTTVIGEDGQFHLVSELGGGR